MKNFLAILNAEGIPFRKSGRTYKVLCPFHGERTPSFTVWPETGRYFCFGCGASGDAIQFLRDYKGFTFEEAAREAGLEIRGRKRAASEVVRDRQKKELRRNFFSWLKACEEAACVAYRELHSLENIPTDGDFISLPGYYSDWHWATLKIEHLLDILQFGTLEEKYLLFREKSVAEI